MSRTTKEENRQSVEDTTASIYDESNAREREDIPLEDQVEVFLELGDLPYWTEMALLVEKVRISAQVRISHLVKTDRRSLKTEELYGKALVLEEYVDKALVKAITDHPTWPWASRIKGVGGENYAKVIGLIERFGRYYDVGDPAIPPHVTREPVTYKKLVQGKPVEKVGIWVEGIERLTLPSKLWRYAGFGVDPDGKAEKRKKGQTSHSNRTLNVCCYRLCSSLIKSTGIWYSGGNRDEGYSRGYLIHKDVIRNMKEGQGVRFLPTPRERHCVDCGSVVKLKTARFCPECGGKLSLKEEPKGTIWLGHLDMMARRKTMKDFLLCLWLVWRQALDLPAPQSYGEQFKSEPSIDPWKMVDRSPVS